jgi:hypothetical protein
LHFIHLGAPEKYKSSQTITNSWERSAANTLTDGRWSPQFFRLNRLRRRGGRDNRFTERHGMSVYRSLANTDECTSPRPGKSHLTYRSSGLVRPNTHAEELLRVVSWVPFPGGVGVDRGSKEGLLFWNLSFCSCILIALTSAPIRARATHEIPASA